MRLDGARMPHVSDRTLEVLKTVASTMAIVGVAAAFIVAITWVSLSADARDARNEQTKRDRSIDMVRRACNARDAAKFKIALDDLTGDGAVHRARDWIEARC